MTIFLRSVKINQRAYFGISVWGFVGRPIEFNVELDNIVRIAQPRTSVEESVSSNQSKRAFESLASSAADVE